MNRLATWFLLSCFFTSHVLAADYKASMMVQAQTVFVDEPRGLSIYKGDAKVIQGSLVLSAKEIQVFTTNQSITKIIAKGDKEKPAHYKQNQADQPRFVEAKALTAIYFVNKQLVDLKGDAHLVQGFDSFSGGVLRYDIKNDKIVANKSKENPQRVRFKIKL